jgi:hypothetical protein
MAALHCARRASVIARDSWTFVVAAGWRSGGQRAEAKPLPLEARTAGAPVREVRDPHDPLPSSAVQSRASLHEERVPGLGGEWCFELQAVGGERFEVDTYDCRAAGHRHVGHVSIQ